MSLYNVQIFAFDEFNEKVELDLYQEEPVKITLSADSLTDLSRIDSSFSRQFRIPATNTNSKLFKWWYEVGVVNFDVTQKVKAEIHVDGFLYKTGQIRLQGAYVNRFRDNIDLEIVFLGETKDFSTEVGDGYMNSLDLGDTAHLLTVSNVEDSWEPFGSGALFLDGKIRYILANRGYNYDSAGVILPQSGGLPVGEVSSGKTQSFTNALGADALNITQMTPIVQIKYLVDKIFDLTSYTYSADSFFNETFFKNLYTDAISADSPFVTGTNQGFEVELTTPQEFSSSVQDLIEWNTIIDDINNAYNPATYRFTVPVTGSYTIVASPSGSGTADPSATGFTVTTRLKVNGVTVDTDTDTISGLSPGGSSGWSTSHSYSAVLTAGQNVFVTVEGGGAFDRGEVDSGTFETTAAPTAINVSSLMKSDVKIIDFFKSILTRFRLVMVPSIDVDNEFIIKTWEDYIGEGNQIDWTDKLDGSKDAVLKPVFYNQSANIIFKDQEDDDTINKYHQEQFNKVYGEKFYDTGNDLLVDTKEISTVFAPTPVNQIPGVATTSAFITPILSVAGTEPDQDGAIQSLPMTPKPRFLYWNGMIASGTTWWYDDDAGTGPFSETDYPRASYLSEIPSLSTSLNLNWEKTFAYFSLGGGPVGNLGQSVYGRYWETYINSIYSPDARILTAYFMIDANDLRELTFDDAIFIKDSWWRIQKVYDAPLSQLASVKVDLVKLLDFIPATLPPTAGFTYSIADDGLTVTFTNTSTDATSYLWDFGDGSTSTATDPVYAYDQVAGTELFPSRTVTLTATNVFGSDADSQSFQVQTTPIGTQAWWRASDGITLNGANVSSWVDNINSIALSQSTAARQPLYNATDANFNNKPSISFDRVQQEWLVSALTYPNYIPHTAGEDVAIMYVFKTSYTGNQTFGLMSRTGGTATFNGMVFESGFARSRIDNQIANSTTIQQFGTATDMAAANWMAATYEASTGAYSFYRDNTSILSGTGNINGTWASTTAWIYAGAFGGNGVQTPAGSYYQGELVEMWVLHHDLTATDRTNFAAYLSSRYNL